MERGQRAACLGRHRAEQHERPDQGGYGVQRKAAGAEQALRTTEQIAGMGLMGLGGLLAVAGGILFAIVVLRALWTSSTSRS